MKSKRINFRATEKEHKEAYEVAKKAGFSKLSHFFWACVQIFKNKGAK